MEILALDAAPRPKVGTRQAEKDRKKGLIPAVVYGHKEASTSVTVPLEGMRKILKAGTRLVKLTLGGRQELTYIIGIDHHPITDAILHIDFGRTSMTEKLSVKVALKVKGVPKVVVAGEGQMDVLISEIPIRCLPDRIPKEIVTDVSALEIGTGVRLKDLHLPEGVEIDGNAELLSITVHKAHEELVATPEQLAAAAATEPEVLTAKKEEGAEGAEAAADKKGGGEKKKE
ncbi:MAG: 50S ribosomal protein L25 [Candidatus Brocadiae bacterium]|nr:50S ribosomal protein L25 [Candidatus Brocadiia bacterium]